MAISPIDAGRVSNITSVGKATAPAPVGNEFSPTIDAATAPSRLASIEMGNGVEPTGRAHKVLKEFEGFILQTFLNSMLPSDSDNVFGKGAAGDAWKSMLAETISKEVTAAGGIGIASVVLRSLGSSTAKTE